MSLAHVFYNQVKNCRVIHPDGRVITFTEGKCITQSQRDIDYLNKLVADGDDYVYVDPKELTVDTEDLTVEGYKRKIAREAVEAYKKEQAALVGRESFSQQGELGMGTTATLVAIVESNGAASITQETAKASEAPAPTGAKVNILASKSPRH